jgi:hypothetical protein
MRMAQSWGLGHLDLIRPHVYKLQTVLNALYHGRSKDYVQKVSNNSIFGRSI